MVAAPRNHERHCRDAVAFASSRGFPKAALKLPTRAFLGTDPGNALITSGLLVIRPESRTAMPPQKVRFNEPIGPLCFHSSGASCASVTTSTVPQESTRRTQRQQQAHHYDQ